MFAHRQRLGVVVGGEALQVRHGFERGKLTAIAILGDRAEKVVGGKGGFHLPERGAPVSGEGV